MFINDEWRAIEHFVKFKTRIRVLRKGTIISLAVLIIIAPIYAHLKAHGYSFNWFDEIVKFFVFANAIFFGGWLGFGSLLFISGWHVDFRLTHELRKALTPSMPNERGEDVLKKVNYIKKWAKYAYVVRYRKIKFALVALPTSVYDELEFEKSLAYVGRRLGQSSKMRYGAWEDLTCTVDFMTSYYKFLVLRKN